MKIDLAKLATAANNAAKKAAEKQPNTDTPAKSVVAKSNTATINNLALAAAGFKKLDDKPKSQPQPKPQQKSEQHQANIASFKALLQKKGTLPNKGEARREQSDQRADKNNSSYVQDVTLTTKPQTPVLNVTPETSNSVFHTPPEYAQLTQPTSPVTPISERDKQTSLTLADLDKSQLAAIDLITSNTRAVLVGSAGTGKSTTVQFILERILPTISTVKLGLLKRMSMEDKEGMTDVASIAFSAYTGIATQRLATKLPPNLQRNCMTIHRLLGYYPEVVEYICKETHEIKERQEFVPYFTSANPLRYDVVFIEEAGMVPAELWNQFVAALLPTTRVYLIGDIAQLPPIMGTSPLVTSMRDLPTAELTHVHRTENDWITQSAQRIRTGRPPDFDTPVTKYMNLDPYPDNAAKQIVAGVIKLFRDGKFDPHQDAIITATNVNDLGQENLNRKLCKYFNPDNEQIKINAVLSRPRYAVGDKIMVTKNDDAAGLANGMIGYVTDITPNPSYKGGTTVDFDKLDNILRNESAEDAIAALAEQEKADSQSLQASHILTAHFPDCYAVKPDGTADQHCKFKTGNSYSNIQHAYAITCHKAQGGEFRQVIIIAHSASGRMLNREWFYTAWTRAKRNIIVLGNMAGINKCINSQQLKGKTLADKVRNATLKLEHKQRQAAKANNLQAKIKLQNSIPATLSTETI